MKIFMSRCKPRKPKLNAAWLSKKGQGKFDNADCQVGGEEKASEGNKFHSLNVLAAKNRTQ